VPHEAVRPLAVFDVDGVLADVRHRLHHVERRPKDWDAFFSAALDDPPLEQGVALAQASAQDCDVVYVTGRPERCRADTLTWFRRHGLPEGELRMRGDRDHRPARVAKPGLLRRPGRRAARGRRGRRRPAGLRRLRGGRLPRAAGQWMAASPVLERAQEDEGRT
jgi:hypothetical protein